MFLQREVDYKEADDYLFLCNKASESLSRVGKTLSSGEENSKVYEIMDSRVQNKFKESNFKGVLFKNGDEYVIAYLGTDIKSLKDLTADVLMAADKNPRQFVDAENFATDMIEKYNIPLNKLTVIGNSEGGSEAIYVKARLGLAKCYTFNGYVPKLDYYDCHDLNNIYNFRTSGDLVSKGGFSVGQDFIVDCKVNGVRDPLPGPLGILDWHRITNMRNIKNAVSIDKYQKDKPDFKNKFRKGTLKSYEIEDIPNDIYALFDADINDRINNHAVVNAPRPFGYSLTGNLNNSHTHAHGASMVPGCAGTYHVNGYTRDGVHVSDYYRTCGATHKNS